MLSFRGKVVTPSPTLTVTKEMSLSEDGSPIGATFTLRLQGSLVAFKGSPTSDGTWQTTSTPPADESVAADTRLTYLLRKQSYLRELFSVEGGELEVLGWDGGTGLRAYCRPRSVSFPEGRWFDVAPYEIVLEADKVYGLGGAEGGDSYLQSASEQWQMEEGDQLPRTYRLTHQVSAKGKRAFDETGTLIRPAWEQAREWVLGRLGFDQGKMEASGVLGAYSLTAYDHARTQSLDEMAGTFSAQETWLCYPGSAGGAVSEQTFDARTGEDGRTRVTAQGTIRGLEQRTDNYETVLSTRFANASGVWSSTRSNLLTRAQAVTNVTLNSAALGEQVGYNESAGTITYAYDYDNRPSAEITGSITEQITIQDSNNADVFARVFVLGRAAGPVLQGLGAGTGKRRTIQIDALMPAKRQGYSPSKPSTASIVTSNLPVAGTLFVERDEEVWSPQRGTYSRTYTVVFE